MYRVKYREYFQSKKIQKEKTACFSGIVKNKEDQTIKIVYLVKAHPTLSIEEIKFWINVLSFILNGNLFSFKIRQTKKGSIIVKWNLNTVGLSRSHVLMYLTAFRYIEEFPNHVKRIFLLKKSKEKEIFDSLILNHMKACHPIEDKELEPVANGHGLMSFYNLDKKTRAANAISLKDFKLKMQEDIKKKNCCRVFDFFLKTI